MSRIDRIYSEKRDYIRMQMEAAVTLHHDDQVTPARSLAGGRNGTPGRSDTRERGPGVLGC